MRTTQTTAPRRKQGDGKAKQAGRKEVAANSDPPTPFASILCAVDGTRASTAAVRTAAALASQGGRLTLLAVTARAGAGAYATAAISPARAQRVLSRAKAMAADAGVEASTAIDPEGPPVDVILDRAREHDLLVIGAPATSWLGGLVLGGVAAAALSQFTTPLLVVRRAFSGRLQGRSILAASDGQSSSDRVVELAGELGRSYGAGVTIVHALGSESASRPRRIQAQARELQAASTPAVDVYVEPGRAAEVILHAAASTKAALVVLGSRRLRGLRTLGSVSRRVLHEAPCSVLVLPPRQAPQPKNSSAVS
ncbi:MAG TPA: universal stress protein [Solirubrobacteraceae bacterium]|nr:universal stress protein [Solirubrobacteraceae bacterium]